MSGISSGSICWFEEGVTDSFVALTGIKALGFLPGSNCPHYDGEEERRPVYTHSIKYQKLKNGFGVDDGTALHYIGTDLYQAVSSRPKAKAYRVEHFNGEAVETLLPVKYLKG